MAVIVGRSIKVVMVLLVLSLFLFVDLTMAQPPGSKRRFEIVSTFHMKPDADFNAARAAVLDVIGLVLKKPGVVEIRTYANISGSPHCRLIYVLQSMTSWAKFVDEMDPAFLAAINKMGRHITNFKTEMWLQTAKTPIPAQAKAPASSKQVEVVVTFDIRPGKGQAFRELMMKISQMPPSPRIG